MQVEITQLAIYPVKSCAGISLTQSEINSQGLQWDRQWVIVTETGKPLTQRVLAHMVLIQPSIESAHLILDAPSMSALYIDLYSEPSNPIPVRIWDDYTLGSDQGDQAAAWLSQFLGVGCRLIRVHPQARRGLHSLWVNRWLHEVDMPVETTILPETQFGFADGFPFLICNEASLDELNQELLRQGAEVIQMNRFRPNIVVSGIDAYAEDYLSSLVGEGHYFAKLKNCTRCPLPNVDPATGVVGDQPALALRNTRRTHEGIIFGINAALYQKSESTISLGQILQVEFAF